MAVKDYDAGIINGMFALSVIVQLFVYGATKIRGGEGPLHQLAPIFGLPYAIAFTALQYWFCTQLDHPRGLKTMAWSWIVYSAWGILCLVVLHRSLHWGDWTALGAGLSALLLWAAFHHHRI